MTCNQLSRERLWREARAAASVSHPNVCQLYEVGETNGELFIAMELLKGEPLSARLARGRFRCLRVSTSRSRCFRLWRRFTRAESSIATSSHRTSSSVHTESSCSTSVWPAGCRR